MQGEFSSRAREEVAYPALLLQHGLKQSGGTARPEHAQVFCMADLDHSVVLPELGAFVASVARPADRALVESLSVAAQSTRLGLQWMNEIGTWENPGDYAVGRLMAGRALALDKIIREMTASDDPRAGRYAAAGIALNAVHDYLVVTRRNQPLLAAITRHVTENSESRLFVFAGEAHFNLDFRNALSKANVQFAILQPETEPKATDEEIAAYYERITSGRTMYKALALEELAGRRLAEAYSCLPALPSNQRPLILKKPVV